MERVTNKMLERAVEMLNNLAERPTEPWTKQDDGTIRANLGNFHISGAYGGVSLHEMQTDGGGIRDVFGCGHVSKRDLFNRIHAFAQGIRAAQ